MALSARRTLAPVLASLALFAAATVPASAQAQVQLGTYLTGGGGSASTLDSYASMVGGKPGLFLVFRNMGGPMLYSSEITNLRNRGETPMVTLEPYVSGGVASFADIAAGKYDSYFKKEADAIRGLGMTVMVRFAHEMNLLSSDWAVGKVGNTAAGYVEAWRHIVTVFRTEGAGNVKWVWAPNVDYGGRPFNQFYPGEEWVDYTALDGYNWGTSSGGSFQTFSKIFLSSYTTITQLSSKPVIITETAASETGGNKAAWIEETYFETIPQKMPRVAGVIWFNDNKERDWRVESSQSSLDAYRKVVASSLYGGTQPPPGTEEAPPIVKELEVTPVVTPAPAPEPAPAPAPAPAPEPSPESAPAPAPETAPAPAPESEPVPTTEPPTAPAPAPEPAPTTQPPTEKPKSTHQRHRRGITLRGRVTYRLSHRGTVRLALHRRGSHARPLVFSAEQNAGHKRVPLAKLVGKRHLGRGRYSVSVVAFSPSGKRSHPRHHGFHIVPPKK
ncbi:MAG: glycoside hydrolase family 26 protein [Solirubrobacterales bacterium]